MSALLPIPDIIEIADVSVYLSSNDNSNGALFGARLASPISPIEIALINDALRWGLEGNPTDSTLRGTANYLYWLCGKYGLQAQYIISGSGGGTVVPVISKSYEYYSLEATIGNAGNDLPTYQNDLLVGGTQLTYILIDNTANTLGVDFTFDNTTGTITLLNGNHFFTGSNIVIPFNKLI